jgi:multicomponent K+:H+ antiporter subunit G
VLSGLLVLAAASGFIRFKDYFMRLHAVAIVYSGSGWCAGLASVLYLSRVEGRVMLHPWLIMVILAITAPVTTLLLARVTLFRRRATGVADTPGPLG